MVVEVDDRNVGALLGEADRDRAADPAVATGDQRGPALELARGPVVAHLRARLGHHLRAPTWLTALLLSGVVRRLSFRHGEPSRLKLMRARESRVGAIRARK
jgi:hypothetical protein